MTGSKIFKLLLTARGKVIDTFITFVRVSWWDFRLAKVNDLQVLKWQPLESLKSQYNCGPFNYKLHALLLMAACLALPVSAQARAHTSLASQSFHHSPKAHLSTAVSASYASTSHPNPHGPTAAKAVTTDRHYSYAQNSFEVQPLAGPKVSFHSVIQRVAPAVVSVYASNNYDEGERNIDQSMNYYFAQTTLASSRSVGSGVMVGPEGLIITNAHVVERRNHIVVVLNNGKKYEASILTINSNIDLALLQIQSRAGEDFPYLKISDESEGKKALTQVGDVILALGNPFGIGQTVSMGIVSGFRYFEGQSKVGFSKLIQIDAVINPGSSGGAVVDSTGKLVGITSLIYSYANRMQTNMGFAIPTQVVKLFMNRYLGGGYLKKYWIGLKGTTVDSDLAYKAHLPYPKGAYIEQLTPRGPAEKAGLKPGDVIIAFDNTPIDTISDLTFAVADLENDDSVRVMVMRNGQKVTVTLKPTIPIEEPKMNMIELKGPFLGVQFVNNSPFVSYQVNSDGNKSGVVVYSVAPDALLKKLGLQPGDFLLKLGQRYIKTTADLKDYIESISNANKFELVVQRRREVIHITISGDNLFHKV